MLLLLVVRQQQRRGAAWLSMKARAQRRWHVPLVAVCQQLQAQRL